MEQQTEIQLIKEAQNNMEAFGSLYDHYFPMIYSYCMNRSGKEELTAEVTRRTFLRSAEIIKSFDFDKYRNLGPLLFAVAHSYLQEYFKQEVLEDTTAVTDVAPQLTVQQQVIDILNSLDERYAEIISLKYYSGLSTIEIAETMDIKPSHVPVLLFRAIDAFRDEFKAKYPDTGIFYSI